jgi:hypothetical protein
MRYFVGALLLIISLSSCKRKGVSDLQAYSYLFVGIKSMNGGHLIYPIGTCFFVKLGNNTFLVTTKHNINGCNTFTLKPTSAQYDTMGFRYYNNSTKQVSYSSLNMIPIKGQLPNNYFYQSPDIVVLKMNDTVVEPYIHPIEMDMFDERREGEEIDSIISYGFGIRQPDTLSNSTQSVLYEGLISSAANRDPFYPIMEFRALRIALVSRMSAALGSSDPEG